MSIPNFFWLHIKKSAGISTRNLLSPHYVQVNRKKVKTFRNASPAEFNDILNNYRVILGKYQFKRALYAKEKLFPEDWDKIFSFAFSREPVDRCISMFYYLYFQKKSVLKDLSRLYYNTISIKKLTLNESYSFDAFLSFVEQARSSPSIHKPIDLHFTTHTATMWEDVTDFEGNQLLTKIYRLSNLNNAINEVFENCGLEKKDLADTPHFNRNKNRRSFNPSKEQIRRIEQIYEKDFTLYENAG